MNNPTPPSFYNDDKRLSSLKRSLEALTKSNADTNATLNKFMQTTGQLLNSNSQAIARLETQVGQLASTVNEREWGKLPSQPEPNLRTQNSNPPQGNQVNAIHTLRSRKQVDNKVETSDIEEDITVEPIEPSKEKPTLQTQVAETKHEPIISKAPFPNWLRSNKQSKHLDKMLEVFKQVQMNIPLLNMIQQVSSYAKILKDLCTKKRTTNVPKRAFLAANVSSYWLSHMPIKYKDSGSPTILCTIGETHIEKALLDLGASVNILSYSVYEQLGLKKLQPIGIIL